MLGRAAKGDEKEGAKVTPLTLCWRAVAGEIDAMCVVHDAIEDGVGVGWIADQIVPFVDGDLTGDDGGSPAVAFFEDFEKVVACCGVERFEPPIVESR